MKVLIVGGGGREHALCWAISRSFMVERLYAAPGNAGIGHLASLVPIAADDVEGIVTFAERESIDLTVVGPEAPLVAGLADELELRGLRVFGPARAAARIEGSKAWSRTLCEKHGIPCPQSSEFDEIGPALDFLAEMQAPYVIKADGLAAGKGVTVAEDRATAERALKESLVDRIFGDAGRRVLVEEYLEGFEVSAMALVDGRTVKPLAFAQDYKRALDGDRGPNTGGMGSISPVPAVDPPTETEIVRTVLERSAAALEDEGVRYRGVLYAGLMVTSDGPKVLEFNCRFGDPETQVVIPRLQSNLGELLLACVEGNLGEYELNWTPEACVGVVLAAAGYPGPVKTGVSLSGLDQASRLEGVQLFHAGTVARDGRVLTAGGRVLTVTALGQDHQDARQRAYEACSRVRFDGIQYRRDIGDLVRQGAL
ncbi:MAG TPA: phosphoribosylamine--glycine ligase [Actinomycetota bacterium]|nr:phosphoribosylamine--glycine ligase [Actinomycetota bacterium]